MRWDLNIQILMKKCIHCLKCVNTCPISN
ncbi:4Fe-4S binding protein [Agathobacter rectalis]|nr:4Fe-4S binding protein [uncultured Agathobacter sp.]